MNDLKRRLLNLIIDAKRTDPEAGSIPGCAWAVGMGHRRYLQMQ